MTPPKSLAPRFEPLDPVPGAGKPSLDLLAQTPEDSLWLANFTSDKTRETYRQAILQFIKAAGLRERSDFQRVSRAAVIAWRDQLMAEGRSRRTVKNRLSALSSLFDHLTAHGVVEKNVVKEVDRPKL
ncbi:MAG: site-specific integrase, partial [Chloroflexota bacterium]